VLPLARRHSAKWASRIAVVTMLAVIPALSTPLCASAASVSPFKLVNCHHTGNYGTVCHTTTNGNTYGGCVTRNGSMTCAIRLAGVYQPTITSLSRTGGPLAGDVKLTITGNNFCHGRTPCVPSSTTTLKVRFGTTTAVFTLLSTTSISANAPNTHVAGTVRVSVVTTGGTSPASPADLFDYAYRVPAVSGVSPASGSVAGGTSVTVSGSWFTGATAVYFGTTEVTTSISVNPSASQLLVPAPICTSGASVYVRVVTPGGTSSAVPGGVFTCGPVVKSLSRTTGPIAGGRKVTITGNGFTTVEHVKFGTATSTFTVKSATQITATTPDHSAGKVRISVTTAAGTTPTSSADLYAFH
jgi:hypothetical protein